MSIPITLLIVACLCCLLLTPLCTIVLRRCGIIDKPDLTRKLHKLPTVSAGGVPLALSYFGSLILTFTLLPAAATLLKSYAVGFWVLLPAVLVVLAVGLVDDVRGLSPKTKLFAECVAATWVASAGVCIQAIGDHPVHAWWAVPFSILFIVLATNAFNLIDGLDGLASGVALFASLATLIWAIVHGNAVLALAAAPLAGALLGFLYYNFAPASIFLGDCGSLPLGFTLGCFAIVWSQTTSTAIGMLAPLFALALPLMDAGVAIVRRFLTNQPIFQADRGHIHHKLLARGLTPRRAALALYAFSCIAVVLAVLHSSCSQRTVSAFILLGSILMAVLFIRALGYVELSEACRIFFTGRFRQLLQEEINLRDLHDKFQKAQSFEQYWRLLHRACTDIGFPVVRLDSPGAECNTSVQTDNLDGGRWRIEAPIAYLQPFTLSCVGSGNTHQLLRLITMLQNLAVPDTLPKPVPVQPAPVMYTWKIDETAPATLASGTAWRVSQTVVCAPQAGSAH